MKLQHNWRIQHPNYDMVILYGFWMKTLLSDIANKREVLYFYFEVGKVLMNQTLHQSESLKQLR